MIHALCSLLLAAAVPPQDYPFRPVPFTEVRLEDRFWRPRLETNRLVTIPYALRQCEETGRIRNFEVAAGLAAGPWTGDYGFNDSDVSKVIEGASYCLSVAEDPALARTLLRLAGLYAAAQEPDGYLYTFQTARATLPADARVACVPRAERWDDIASSHEIYNAGHLFEAAAAHFQATGERALLDVAIRNADLICREFGPDGRLDPPGHEEIELGLAKLYRVTGERRYLEQARLFLERRGRFDGGRRSYGRYAQDHRPLLEQDEAVGHAVRANYLYAAMADVAALAGDAAYLRAIDRLWADVVGHKLYLTGGVGATGSGEAFGERDELPNRTAYAETCAAIANVYWNHRMFLLHGDAAFIDVLERSLYNGVLSGVSLDGRGFFYTNPLASAGEHARSPWFGCACCPSNLTRFLASVGGYAYAVRGDAVHVNLYLAGRAEIEVGERALRLRVTTDYPWDGGVAIEVDPGPEPLACELRLRLPGWARGQPVPSALYRYAEPAAPAPRLRVAGEEIAPVVADALGYLSVRRVWRAGDRVELELPMPVRRVLASEAVAADRGRVALERGPLVYCVEHPDVPDGRVSNLVLPDAAALAVEPRAELLGGVAVLVAEAQATRFVLDGGERRVVSEPVRIAAIPYALWAHRGRGEMAVWLARSAAVADPLPAPTAAARAAASASGGEAAALNDQREPDSSGDATHPFLHWWPRKGTVEWIQYDFPEPLELHRAEVYWFDDTGRGECRLPRSWRLLYRDGAAWREVPEPSGYPIGRDRYDEVRFAPRTTTALRLEVQLQDGWAAGVHEWRVE